MIEQFNELIVKIFHVFAKQTGHPKTFDFDFSVFLRSRLLFFFRCFFVFLFSVLAMGCCLSCCAMVPQSSVGMIEQWGRFVSTAHPGCNFLNPCLCQNLAGTVSLRVQQLDVRCETKTHDNVFVMISCSVQYHVIADEVFTAFYTLSDPHSQIEHYVFDVVRATVPKVREATLNNTLKCEQY